jgi:hypothetical protein
MISRAVVALALAPAIVTGLVPSCSGAGPLKPRVPSKVSRELLALHEAYSEAQRSGTTFRPNSPLLRIEDDRVLIDATAAADGETLKANLVGLGMRHAVAFERVVSGWLPIAAIPALDGLESLAFVRASAATHSPGAGGTPRGP